MKKNEKSVILIVDDKPADILALKNLLASNDRIFLHANSGKDALKIALDRKPDLIILDVQMPQIDGFEVAQILESNNKTSDIPFLASAKKNEHAFMMKGYEGAIDYLFKPLDPEITKAKVSVSLKFAMQKKQLTEKIALTRNHLATVVQQSNDSIYVHDQEGKIISWNEGAERIYGYTESEALEMKIWNIVPADLQPGMAEMVAAMMAGRKIELLETKRLRKDGKLIDVLLSASIISDPGAVHRSMVITERDITQQKIADEQIRFLKATLERNVLQLQAANRELEAFSYSVSHDLRAPLRAIHGNAVIMQEDYGDKLGEDAAQVIAKIQGNASRMDGLIKDLLAFSRIGQKEVRKSVVSMEELVRNTFSEVSQAYPHKAQIKTGPLPEAYGDYALLNQVWMNLISNAIKYSAKKENPCIDVGSRETDGQIEYFIRDNGAGFDMKYANKLFGTFQRLHDVTEFEGTGMGLAIVKRIILKHGGTINAHAEPEKGATFFFTIPAE